MSNNPKSGRSFENNDDDKKTITEIRNELRKLLPDYQCYPSNDDPQYQNSSDDSRSDNSWSDDSSSDDGRSDDSSSDDSSSEDSRSEDEEPAPKVTPKSKLIANCSL